MAARLNLRKLAGQLSEADIARLLQMKKTNPAVARLEKQRSQLEAKLADVNRQLEALNGEAPAKRRGRPPMNPGAAKKPGQAGKPGRPPMKAAALPAKPAPMPKKKLSAARLAGLAKARAARAANRAKAKAAAGASMK